MFSVDSSLHCCSILGRNVAVANSELARALWASVEQAKLAADQLTRHTKGITKALWHPCAEHPSQQWLHNRFPGSRPSVDGVNVCNRHLPTTVSRWGTYLDVHKHRAITWRPKGLSHNFGMNLTQDEGASMLDYKVYMLYYENAISRSRKTSSDAYLYCLEIDDASISLS